MNNYKVYKHTNNINGKIYVGITQQKPEDRFKSGSSYVGNKHFKSAIKKYGWNNFSHEILEDNLDRKEAMLKETHYINFFESNNSSKGYNKSTGGEAPILNPETRIEYKERFSNLAKSRKGKPLSKETRIKISIANKGKKFPGRGIGKTLSEETKLKISKSNSGKKRSEEVIEKNRLSHLGKKISEDHKRKISESMKLVKAKKVIGKNILTNKMTEIFNSVEDAAKHFNLVNSSCITNCCKGRTKSSAGHIWKYID